MQPVKQAEVEVLDRVVFLLPVEIEPFDEMEWAYQVVMAKKDADLPVELETGRFVGIEDVEVFEPYHFQGVDYVEPSIQ